MPAWDRTPKHAALPQDATCRFASLPAWHGVRIRTSSVSTRDAQCGTSVAKAGALPSPIFFLTSKVSTAVYCCVVLPWSHGPTAFPSYCTQAKLKLRFTSRRRRSLQDDLLQQIDYTTKGAKKQRVGGPIVLLIPLARMSSSVTAHGWRSASSSCISVLTRRRMCGSAGV
jgi:hypothetical protein